MSYQAVICPACKKVMVKRGIWVHILAMAKSEALTDQGKHYQFIRKDAKKYRIVKYVYTFPFKVVHENYYEWNKTK